MSSNSYPSPISSSATTPRLHATRPAMDLLDRTGPRRPRQGAQLPTAPGDIDTVAASFRARLEQVRREFLEISNGLPEPASQLRGRGEVGPTHDAIMLAGEGESPAEDTSPDMSTQELIDAYDYSFRRVVQAQSSLAAMAEQASVLRQSMDHIPTPPLEPPAQGRFRHQPLPLPSPRAFALSPDDGFTTMGRRVAAREQAAQRRALARTDTLPADDHTDVPRAPEPPPLPHPSTLARTNELRERLVAREVELQANHVRHLRQEAELQALEARRLRQELSELQLQSIEARRLSQVQNQLASPASPGGPVLWRQEPPLRRRRLLRTDTLPSTTGSSSGSGSVSGTGTRSTLSSEQSRLSMLSGSLHDMQNLPSPTAPAVPSLTPGPRALLFDEPESWVQSPRGTFDTTDFMVDEITTGRNYLIRRRMAPDGTERVQNITLPEPSNPDLLGMYAPRVEPLSDEDIARRRAILQSLHDSRATRLPSFYGGIPRRRGMVRLDGPGTGYSAEDEEELERALAEIRQRRAMDPNFDPDGASPPNPQGARLGSSFEDKNSLARILDPLPMGLNDMVIPAKRARYAEDNVACIVDGWASFAGR